MKKYLKVLLVLAAPYLAVGMWNELYELSAPIVSDNFSRSMICAMMAGFSVVIASFAISDL